MTDYEQYYSNGGLYEFINNITTGNYHGQWRNGDLISNKILLTHTGRSEIEFKKIFDPFTGKVNKTSINMVFLGKDDRYIDHYIKGNLTLHFDTIFKKGVNRLKQSYSHLINGNKDVLVPPEVLSLTNPESKIDFYLCSFLQKCERDTYNNTTTQVDFYFVETILKEEYAGVFISPFSKIKIKIRHNLGSFSCDIDTTIKLNNNNLTRKSYNYSFILTIGGIIEMYYIIDNIGIIKNDGKKCLGMDIITVCLSVISKIVLCTIHFYLSITSPDDELSYIYSIPAIIYFVQGSLFEFCTLYILFKAKFYSGYETNPSGFRSRGFQFSFGFYLIVFVCLVLCKLMIMNFASCYFVFFSVWFFQIFHTMRVGIRPQMKLGYLIAVSLWRLFVPIYFRAFPDNGFEFKPNYLRASAVISTIIIELIIVILQKNFGAKVIVPWFLKESTYNYYFNNLSSIPHLFIEQNTDCAICLNILCPLKEEANKEREINEEFNHINSYHINNRTMFITKANGGIILENGINRVSIWYESFMLLFTKRQFMITPCDHAFHTECLEKWGEIKNDCPYCKQLLPLLD